MVSLREFRVLVLGTWRLGPGRLLQRSSELITTLPWESETRRSDDIIYQIQARFLEVDLVVIFTYSCSIIAQHVRYGTFRNICGRTHQSYTVGLLGVPGASPPSAILPFRASGAASSSPLPWASSLQHQDGNVQRYNNISRVLNAVLRFGFGSTAFNYPKVA
jgi:hypothetical protein